MAQTQLTVPVQQRPSKSAGSGVPDQPRLDNYLAQYVQTMTQFAHAQAGHLWVASNPTSGTGIASHAAPTVTDGSKPLFSLQNTYATGTDKHVMLQSVKFGVTVAGAGATASRFYIEKSASGTSRFTSGGSTNLASTALVLNFTGPAAAATSSVVRLGAIVAPTDANAQLLYEGEIRSIIPKVSDQILFTFGDLAGEDSATLLDIANTNPIMTRFRLPAVDLAPGETLLIHLVNASQSGASSYTMKAIGIER